jgi:hypothetical protein
MSQKKKTKANQQKTNTMPEEDQMPPAEMPMPEAPVAPPMPQDGGSVMISMPRDAFNAMREIVSQLAMGLDQLAQSVEQQSAPTEGQPPVAASAPAPVPPGEDEEFLKSMAEEASAGR